MRNLKVEIEYDGTNYAGWQVQLHAESNRHKNKTIQGLIEKALRRILHEKIKLIVSGRTDAGVHAKAQIANFLTNSDISLKKLFIALNSLLPEDIKISKIKEAPLEFHSRFCAKSKLYRYLILNHKHSSVFFKDYVYFCPYPLDLALMQEEAACLIGRHDFKSFCASGSAAKNTQKTIKRISVRRINLPFYGQERKFISIDIEADSFLYNMVRNIVGTLLEIGRGRFKKGYLKKVLAGRDRKLAGQIAPAKGLCLLEVKF